MTTKNILITGKPGVGKTTLLKRILDEINSKLTNPRVVGFMTEELKTYEKSKRGCRKGFDMVLSNGTRSMIASIHKEDVSNSNVMVSKYYVDVDKIASLVNDLTDTYNEDDILYIDEIGLMQLYCEEFKKLCLKYINSPNILIATIKYNDSTNKFLKSIKSRDDVVLIEVESTNREECFNRIMSFL